LNRGVHSEEATKIFRDGQTLCVDGDRGVVEVLE